jgi:cytochrome b
VKNNKSDNRSAKEHTGKKVYSIPVWDIPTRIFHWLLAGLVILSFITGKIGGTAMKYHELGGFAVLSLVVFRLVWGVIGGQQSRFSAFVKGPATVLRYASSLPRKDSTPYIGHNPLGGWSIIAMLISLLIQTGTGLFANDDILTEGPLYDLVSKHTSDWLTGLHHLNRNVLLGLVVLHICAIMFYLLAKRENLLVPMITGKKTWEHEMDSAYGNPMWALLLAVVVTAVAYFIIY